jgi:hypothetical protein
LTSHVFSKRFFCARAETSVSGAAAKAELQQILLQLDDVVARDVGFFIVPPCAGSIDGAFVQDDSVIIEVTHFIPP